MLSVEKVATPLTAAIGPPPVSVPPPGFVPIARVTFPVNVVAVFPAASSAVTRTAGVIAAPAVVLLGDTVNTSWVGVTVVMLNSGLLTAVSPLEVARRRYPLPALLMDRSENVATPATAATVLVPESVPPPGFALAGILSVTFPVNCVTVLPNASCAVTCTGGVITAPAGVLLGGAVNASCVAAPAVPLAVKVTGLPVTPDGEAVAVRVFVPTVWLSVQLPTVAMPLPLVV